MEQDGIHGLTAAYALDALDEADEQRYEEHLRGCARCRNDLAALTETAASLAYAVDSPLPPAALRERILDAARAESSKVIPFRRRRWNLALPALATTAAAAATLAIALGLWAVSLSRSLDEERTVGEARERALALVAGEGARQVSFRGGNGQVVVAADGRAVLVLNQLEPAPANRTYEAWVIEDGRPVPAGTFDASDKPAVHVLTKRVRPGDLVAVTLEPKGGSALPTGAPLLRAEA